MRETGDHRYDRSLGERHSPLPPLARVREKCEQENTWVDDSGVFVVSSEHVNDLLQDMIEGHFKFYKQVTDNPEFAKVFLDWLFERYLSRSQE